MKRKQRSLSRGSQGSPPPPAIYSFVFIVAAMFGLSCLPPTIRANDEEQEIRPDVKFVEPILTEETMPNEPRELNLRVSIDYRKRGSEAIGALPRIELFYGLVNRLGAELSVPLAYHHGDGQTSYGLGDVSMTLKYLVVEHRTTWPAVVFGIEAGFRLEVPLGSWARARMS